MKMAQQKKLIIDYGNNKKDIKNDNKLIEEDNIKDENNNIVVTNEIKINFWQIIIKIRIKITIINYQIRMIILIIIKQ